MLIKTLRKIFSKQPNITMDVARHFNFRFIKQLYAYCETAQVASVERLNFPDEQDNFIYGFIPPETLTQILDALQLPVETVFYDLGSGDGQTLLTVALNFSFQRIIGVECLTALCEIAAQQISRAKIQLTNLQDTVRLAKLSAIEMIATDLRQIPINQGSVVFINATCFDYYLWEAIQEKLLTLKPASYVIVTSKKLTLSEYVLRDEQLKLMSWGGVTVRIYQKIG